MKRMIALVLLAAGCATGAGVIGHQGGATTYALDAVVLGGIRAGELSASREWQRADGGPARDDADQLRAAFVRDLSQRVRIDPAARQRVRATLTLQDTGYFEGLAAETADLTLVADIYDDRGQRIRSITLREAASAPLQRSASRRARLEQALGRLSSRLAAAL